VGDKSWVLLVGRVIIKAWQFRKANLLGEETREKKKKNGGLRWKRKGVALVDAQGDR